MGKWLIRLVLVLSLASAVWAGWRAFAGEDEWELRTVSLVRGPLALTVTATGHLAPTTEVLVGCEISGTVEAILAAHNDRVSRGEVIARLKPELFRAEHQQAKAELARAKAHVRQLEVQEQEAKRQYERVEELRNKGAASDDEYETVRASYRAAEASTEAGRAAVQGAESQVELTAYRLERTVITSPIDGIVLDCRVDVGQTVAAALMTPELFVLAEDLSRMELLADVSEADVGYVCPGQRAVFTVNAYRDRTFEGQVRQVRNQPRTVSNVVTYTVVIDVANDDHLLRPGMPADIHIEIVRREDSPKIANSALRFRPPLPANEIRAILDQLQWPPAPEPIRVTAGARPATRPGGEMEIVPPPLEPARAALWQYEAGRWNAVPVWTAFTDNRETVVYEGPDVLEGASFVAEVRGAGGSGSSRLEQAILLSRPEHRRL